MMTHSSLSRFATRLYSAIAITVVLSLSFVAPIAAQSDEIDDIINEVSEIRGLSVMQPIAVIYKSREELQEEVNTDFFEDYTEADIARDQRTMVAFGIIRPDQSIRELYSELYGGQIAGYYDPESADLVVIETDDGNDDLSAMEEFTLAHEINHALQDQHFDIDAGPFDTIDATDDVSVASTALIEGDAILLQGLYLQANPAFARDLGRELNNDDGEDTSLDEFPPVIVALLLFPYDGGYEFANALYEDGGYGLVNQAFDSPPITSEQILHPDKYLDGEVGAEIKVLDPTATLGSGWTITDENTFGEFLISSVLASDEASEDDAEEAAEGWNGDAYTVSANGDQTAVVWQSSWDADDDAQEFAESIADRESSRFDADIDDEGGIMTISGDGVVVIVQVEGANVTYVQAPDAVTAEELMANQNGQ